MDVLIPEADVAARVRQIGAQIRHELGDGAPLHLIGVLKGSFMFLADLLRAIPGPVTCDFVAVSSYGAGRTSCGELVLNKDLDQDLAGRDVVLVEDIVDTGLTLEYLQQTLQARGPHSLRTACLLDKPSRRRVSVHVDYVGFTIPDLFVVGYGLDFNQMHRNLAYVGVLKEGSGA